MSNPSITMNFFSSLFAQKKVSISAREILENIRVRMKGGTCTLSDAVFFAVVGPSVRLCESTLLSQSLGGSIQYVSQNDYDSDGVSFEIAAFLMSKADTYLFIHHRESHGKNFDILCSKFVDTFSSAIDLSPKRTRDLLDERLTTYSRISHSESNSNRVLSLVSSAIHDTLDNGGSPKSPMRNEPPPTISVDDLVVVKSLSNMDAAFSPQMRTSIDRAVAHPEW